MAAGKERERDVLVRNIQGQWEPRFSLSERGGGTTGREKTRINLLGLR